MPPSRRSLPALAAAALYLLAAVSLAACGGDDDQADPAQPTRTTEAVETTTTEPPVTTEPEESTTTAQLTDEEAVLAAVEGYWQTIRAASDPPNPAHPDLEQFASGPALEVAVENLTERRQLGQAVRLPEDSVYEHRLSEVSVTAESATVRDCGIDDAVLYDVLSGIVLNGEVVTNHWTITLTFENNAWKVTDTNVDESWDGVAGCALDS